MGFVCAVPKLRIVIILYNQLVEHYNAPVSVRVHDRGLQQTFPCVGVLVPNILINSNIEVRRSTE